MAKSKQFRVSVEGKRWVCVESRLYLTDGFEHFNHPSIVMRFRREDRLSDEWGQVSVELRYQRHRIDRPDPISGSRSADWEGAAEGYMDTAHAWGRTYGGSVELDDARRFHIADHSFTLGEKDQLRVAVARKVARTISTFNLHAVHGGCECKQAVDALGRLGAPCERIYQNGRIQIPLRELESAGAARRYLDEKQQTRAAAVANG